MTSEGDIQDAARVRRICEAFLGDLILAHVVDEDSEYVWLAADERRVNAEIGNGRC